MAVCGKCGNKLDDSVKFCESCGAPVKNKGSAVKSSKEIKQSRNKTKPKKRLPLIIIICVVVASLLGGGIFACLKLWGIKSKEQKDYEVPSEYYAEYPDVEKYFEENSKVINVTPAGKSTNVYSEKQIIEELKSRGFKNSVTTDYSIEGKYNRPAEISENSSAKHPVYETYYVTSNNKVWTISVIEGTIIATPSSYNIENNKNVPVVVSESKEIVSYDSSKNQFYRTVPNAATLSVRVVDRIDAKTLESISLEG